MQDNDRRPSIWAPLRQPLFRTIWIMSLVSNIGTWMQEIGGGWLMASLTTSPALIGLLETALTLPLFILSLPAGALADILDKRRILIATQTWMTLFAAAMGIITLLGGMSPALLLTLTFVLSIGSAVNGPPWQAILPEIIERKDLPAAVALGSVGFNLARAIGPALGGAIIVALGPGATFLFNALSFLGVIIVLYRWKREHHASVLPAERMMSAMRAGIRYARHAPMLQAVLVRTLAFILFGSAMWALLPFIAKHELQTDSLGYGILIACFGIGAVLGAAVLTRVQRYYSVDVIVRIATVLFVVLLLALGIAKTYAVVCCAMLLGGGAWMMLMSSLNVAAQLATPPWVRARAMAIYILVFFGGFAGGAAIWGFLATTKGTTAALLSASLGALAGMLVTMRFKLTADTSIDHTPSMHWAEPVIAVEPEHDQGPVMITVEYTIDPADGKAFSKAIHDLSRIRMRDGAVQWGIFNDVADSRRYIETFVVESWLEHLRQHERVTITDRALEDLVHRFHKGTSPPKVEHFIYQDEN
jgi:MFS family permease